MSKRWIEKTTEAAAKPTPAPWERGARRAAMIAKRLDQDRRAAKISLAPLPEGLCLSA
ncbi:hypothetical protein [Salipiger sp. IMCC34102]|uniref:hypothetical protein n=1 Tax=Salipiger sp. IMCC34102 TaxID=2510647 RepID=UPI0013EA4940|nr:hypothetical protein [Salipiger sp. IMCC34102]